MNKRSNYFYHTIIWIISEKEIIICCNFIILGINKNTMFFYSHQKKIYIKIKFNKKKKKKIKKKKKKKVNSITMNIKRKILKKNYYNDIMMIL